MSFPIVRQIRCQEEAHAVLAAARANNDSLIHPTHCVTRNGEIIGAASIGAVPLLLVWNHTEKVRAADSLHLKRVYDAIMETKGAPRHFVACNQHSPYNAHMKRFGYQPIWTTEIFEGGT